MSAFTWVKPAKSAKSVVLIFAASLAMLVSPLVAARSVSGQSVAPQNTNDDKVQTVAVVKGEAISRQQLAKACLARFGTEVLESVVNKMLIEEACAKQGISITDREIMLELKKLADNVGEGISVAQYLEIIAEKRNIKPEKVKDDIIWTQLALRRLAERDLQISDEEVNNVMQREYGPKVQASMIVENSLQQAKVLHQAAVANPENFGRLAKDYSVDPSTAPYMGLAQIPFTRGMADPNMEQALFSLKEGDISDVIESNGQFFIFKCNRVFPAMELSDSQYSIVATKVREALKEKKLHEVGPQLHRQMQDQARVVNVMGDENLSQQYPGVAALVNQQQISIQQLAEECIARYGVDVLEVEIHRTMLMQELKANNLVVSDQDLRAEITRTAQAAGQVDANGNVDLNAWLNRVTENDESKIDYYVQDAVWPSAALRKLVEGNIEVTQEDMQKGFEANYGERVRVLAIVTNDLRKCEKIWKMARDNQSVENFGNLAEAYSEEPISQYNRGEVPPIGRFSGRPNLEQAAFALQQGELSQIVNEGPKWIILYCLGRTKPVVSEMDSVKEELYKELYERKAYMLMGNRMQQIVDGADIDNFLTETTQYSKKSIEAVRASQQPPQRSVR